MSTGLNGMLPATSTARWGTAVGFALIAHLTVGTGVAQWGYGGASDGEVEAISIDLPPLSAAEIAAAPKFTAAVQPKSVASQNSTAPTMAPQIPLESIPQSRFDVPKDTPILAPSVQQPLPQPAQSAPTTPQPEAREMAQSPAATVPTATSGVTGGSNAGDIAADDPKQKEIEADYKSVVSGHIGRSKFSPPQSRKAGLSGVVQVQFTIDRSGSVKNVSVAASSGHAILDQEALAHIRKISPVPAFPRNLRKAEIPLKIKLKYDVERK